MERVAIPALLEVRARLQAAGHRAEVQDLTRLEPARARLLFWPRLGPLAVQDASRYTIEFRGDPSVAGSFSAAFGVGDRPDPTFQAMSGVRAKADAAWFERQCTAFLERVLSTL